MKGLFASGAIALLLAGVGCSSSVDDTEVLARVGPREITVEDYRAAYLKMNEEVRPALETLEQRESFLSDMIDKNLMDLASEERFPELNERQKRRMRRFREKELRDRVERRLVRNHVKITDGMMRQLYDNLHRQRHLLAMNVLDLDEARYVMKRLEKGDAFSSLANDHSAQWTADHDGGDRGWMEAGSFVWPVDKAAWEAPVGTTVGPFAMPLGNYIVHVVDERPNEVPASYEDMAPQLENRLMENLYLNRQKAVQDSIREAKKTVYRTEGKGLVMLKYLWEPPLEYQDDPMAKLNAPRYAPTYTQEEGEVVVVDFEGVPDWTLDEFARRLEWYPTGLWPSGESEEELEDLLDMMTREYLKLQAAYDLGIDQEPSFQEALDAREQEMRATFFYYNEILRKTEPTEQEIASYFEQNRSRYQAPPSYKLAAFSSADPDLIGRLAVEWRDGASFVSLRDRYSASDPDLVAIGESPWFYEGNDFTLDNLVTSGAVGDVTEPITRQDMTTVYRIVDKRDRRLLGYSEVKDAVDKDAKTVLADARLNEVIEAQREKHEVVVDHGALEKLKLEEPKPAA